jgi:hypothetical protein
LPRPADRLLDARVRIERFDPRDDTASLRACFAITDAAWAVDHPNAPPWGVRSFAGKWMDGFDSSPQQAWLGFGESGELVGGYLLQLPDKENLRRAGCTLIVALDKRRAGVGTELLAHCRAGRPGRRAGPGLTPPPGTARQVPPSLLRPEPAQASPR